MSVADEVQPIGIRPAERRPLRALALVGLSRTVLGLMVVGLGWTTHVAWSSMADEASAGRSLVIVEPASIAFSGTSIAAVLDDVRTGIGRLGGSFVDLDVARRSDPGASVRMTVDLPSTSASGVDRLVATLGATQLADLSLRSVDPVPSGLRVVVDASVELASAAPDTAVPDVRAPAVALAAVAERSGVELRGVDIPARPREPVRLAVVGRIEDLIDLVERIEQEHSAPMRIRSLTLRRATADEHEAVLMFVLREDVPWPEVGADR